MRITNKWNLPILISENGIPDKSGTSRSPFILSHISQVKRATDSGADVLGYIYWSFMDNYEWRDAYSPDSRFGLYQMNRNSPDFERLPTQAVDTLRLTIAENNSTSPSDSTISTNRVPESPKPSIAETNEVSIPTGSSNPEQGQGFVPPSIAIETDTTVTWTNNDDTFHTVTSGNPEAGNSGTEFDSSYLAPGKKFQHDFTSTGQYSYYCTLHPFMTGTVYVTATIGSN